MTSITQIIAAARRTLLNQHQQLSNDPKPPPSPSNLAGVVLFIPRIDQLLTRLPSVAAHHLVERLIEVTANNMAVCGTQKRTVLVATVRQLSSLSPSLIPPPPLPPPLCVTGEETQSSRPGALSVRVHPATVPISPRVNTHLPSQGRYFPFSKPD